MKETMNINGSNYEAYFLDYFEKNLDTTGVAELMVFLEANPELKAEFENFELLLISPDPRIIFEDKESLKKKSLVSVLPIHEGNYEEYLISSVENMLSPEEEEKLAAFIALNPVVARELELFRMTVLQPDTTVIFESKNSLKHEAIAPVVRMHSNKGLLAFLAVAASLTILIVLYFTFSLVRTGPQLAEQRQPAIKTSPKVASTARVKPTPSAITSKEAGQIPSLASPNIIPFRSSHALINPYARARKIKSKERTEFSDIYRDYMLRNEIEYSQFLDEQQSRSLLARTFSKLRQGITGEDEYNPNGSEERNVLWSVADLGLKGINAVTNSDLRLVRKFNSEGRTQSYALRSDRVEYSKDLDK